MNNKRTLIALALLIGSGLIGWLVSYAYYETKPQEYPMPVIESEIE